MKRVKGVQEAARILASKKHKIQVHADGKPAFDGHLKTDEIIESYGGIKRFLEGIIDDNAPSTIAIQYGESNGSSWKNPTWIYFDLSEKQESKPKAQPTGQMDMDPFSLNGVDMAPNSSEALKARLWTTANELQRTSSERDRLQNKVDLLTDKNEQLLEENRELKHQVKDLEMDHKREMANLTKPGMLEKLLEREDLVDKIVDILGDQMGPENSLNAANLSEHARAVIDTMQNRQGMDQALYRVVANLSPGFIQDLNALFIKYEQQAPKELDATANAN